MTATNLKGLNITGTIVPVTNKDEYATHDSQYGLGGWHEVKTLAERDAIPVSRRRRGMAVFVLEDGKCYTLNTSLSNGGWQPYGSYDVVDIVKKALESGQLEIDLSDFYKKAEIDDKLLSYTTHTELRNAENILTQLINQKASQVDVDAAIEEVNGQIAILADDIKKVETATSEAKLIAEQAAESVLKKVDTEVYEAKIAEIEAKLEQVADYTFVRNETNERIIDVLRDGVKVAQIPAPKEALLASACFVANELVTYYSAFNGALKPDTLDGIEFTGEVATLTSANGPYLVLKNIDNETGELKGGNVISLHNIIPQIDVEALNAKLAEIDTLASTVETLEAAVETIKEAIEENQFVLRSQGTEKAGQILMVGEDGNLAPAVLKAEEIAGISEVVDEVKELGTTVEEITTEITVVQSDISELKVNKVDNIAYQSDLTELDEKLSEILADLKLLEGEEEEEEPTP